MDLFSKRLHQTLFIHVPNFIYSYASNTNLTTTPISKTRYKKENSFDSIILNYSFNLIFIYFHFLFFLPSHHLFIFLFFFTSFNEGEIEMWINIGKKKHPLKLCKTVTITRRECGDRWYGNIALKRREHISNQEPLNKGHWFWCIELRNHIDIVITFLIKHIVWSVNYKLVLYDRV